MADMKDMKPYSKKTINAKSGAHMVKIANGMSSKVHPRSASGSSMLPAGAKKWGKSN